MPTALPVILSSLKQLCGGSPSLSLAFSLTTTSGVQAPIAITAEHLASSSLSKISLTYANGIAEEILVRWTGNRESQWRRRLVNTSKTAIALVEATCTLSGLKLGGPFREDYFYHPENPRVYDRFAIPVRLKRTAEMVKDSGFDQVAGNKWADPLVVCDRVGASPYQPFPAVLLSNYRSDHGLVHGSLSQRVFYHNHLFTHQNGTVSWEMLSSLKGVAHRILTPGEILDYDDWYLGAAGSRDFSSLFNGYTKVLRSVLPAAIGRSDINRHTASWGSWNDGPYRDIDEKRLLKMADFLRDEFPTVEWMQIDDGYATYSGRLNIAHGLGAPYDGKEAVDVAKFPNGLRYLADQIQQRGIRPAIWIGSHVPNGAPLAKDHPDWFIDYSYRTQTVQVFDVSKPEVRAYMLKALDALLSEPGFEGMKHDFWSYVFEDSHIRLANTDLSGYEWRTWWLQEVRRRLAPTGYLQTGCDIVMANPFLGEFFTNYRYGIDVGHGVWDNFRTNFLWGAACFATHTGDLFIPNSDGIGLFKDMPDHEVLTWINYCIISRSLVEVAGWLYQNPHHPRMRWLRKALACLNNGQDVYFARFDYRAEDSIPAIWYLETPWFTRLTGNPCLPERTVGIFNLGSAPKSFSLKAADLGLSGSKLVATDVWSGETIPFKALAKLTLAAHESRLYTISAPTKPMVLDANLEITAAERTGSSLALSFRHAGKVELVLSAKPRSSAFDSHMRKPVISKGRGNWLLTANLTKPGTLTLKF